MEATTDRVLSGIRPTGVLHLGNYLGAVRNWVADQQHHDAFYCIVDLHALAEEHDPTLLGERSLELTAGLLAAGLDPEVCTIFLQSHVPEHARLSWVLECTATMGELRRMTQFKEKSGDEQESVRVGLFTYPVLMAADILLYDAARVPVGDDQRQHLELARDLAQRFNFRYGDTFVVPKAALPAVGARVMDLQVPTRKMSKSVSSPLGTVLLLDPPDDVARKVRRAVTDTDGEVRYDPEHKPGVSNLLELLSAATDGKDPAELAGSYQGYGALKADVADALVALLEPVGARYAALAADRDHVRAVLEAGARRARQVAAPTLARAMEAIGLLPPLNPGVGSTD